MRKKQIDQFFKKLDKELEASCGVILTGASAGSLMGHVRPSFDIDFEIKLRSRASGRLKAKLEEAIRKTSRQMGIGVNYSENIGGWSMIHHLDYRKKAVPYRTFGKLRVRLMAPEYWTIGKMARFLELDIGDMLQVIRKRKLRPKSLISLWARALRKSALSLALGQFRGHVLFFIGRYGRRAWGRKTDVERLKNFFLREARSRR